MSGSKPLWNDDQAIAYGAALEAVNDVIAGCSEVIQRGHDAWQSADQRIAWLRTRRRTVISVPEDNHQLRSSARFSDV